jgi:hypothetical protein
MAVCDSKSFNLSSTVASQSSSDGGEPIGCNIPVLASPLTAGEEKFSEELAENTSGTKESCAPTLLQTLRDLEYSALRRLLKSIR